MVLKVNFAPAPGETEDARGHLGLNAYETLPLEPVDETSSIPFVFCDYAEAPLLVLENRGHSFACQAVFDRIGGKAISRPP